MKHETFCKRLQKFDGASIINLILHFSLEMDQCDFSNDEQYIEKLMTHPSHDTLFLLLGFTFLHSSNKAKIKIGQFWHLVRHVSNLRKTSGIIENSTNDSYAIIRRSFYTLSMLMQLHDKTTASKSVIRQKQLFSGTEGDLENKFLNKYKISHQDFLSLYKVFLECVNKGQRKFSVDDFTRHPTGNIKSIRYFLDLISLDVHQGKKALKQWEQGLNGCLDLMMIDISTPFTCYPLFKYGDKYHLYSEKLLYVAAHYHLYDLMRKIDSNLGKVFEQYVYLKLEEYKSSFLDKTETGLSRSGNKGTNKEKKADFILKEKGNVIVWETKAIEYPNKSKILQGKNTDNKISEGLEQLISTINTVNIDKDNIYGVLVTYKPYILGSSDMWLSSGRKWADEMNTIIQSNAINPNRLFIISIEDFDDMIDNIQGRNILMSSLLKLIVLNRISNPLFTFKVELQKVLQQLMS